jgi:hypothetical protein
MIHSLGAVRKGKQDPWKYELGDLYLQYVILLFLKRDCGTIPVAEIISGKIEFFSKLQRFLIATESSKYLLIFVLYVCVKLCEFGTAIQGVLEVDAFLVTRGTTHYSEEF